MRATYEGPDLLLDLFQDPVGDELEGGWGHGFFDLCVFRDVSRPSAL